MKNLVFFLEGHSEKEMLKEFIPRLFQNKINPIYIVFNGKQDLEQSLSKKLSGWIKPESAFVILLDQDQEDCEKVKGRLIEICNQSASSHTYIVRIACHELESWYFGDLSSVGKALQKPDLIKYKHKQKYREPDKIKEPSKELIKITNNSYQKIASSREIGKYLSTQPNRNTSPSFHVFIKGIKGIMNN